MTELPKKSGRIPLKVGAIEDFEREFPCLGSFEVWFLDCKLLEGEGPWQPGEMNSPQSWKQLGLSKYTLPKFNMVHLKTDGWKTILTF